MESFGKGNFGVTGNKFSVNTKCAGLGGGCSSIAPKKVKPQPKVPKSDIFAAKTYVNNKKNYLSFYNGFL